MNKTDIFATLGARPLFAQLSEAGLHALAEAARPMHLVKGQRLFDQGEASDAVYVVAHGTVSACTVGEDGQQAHFADLAPGTVFGELAVIDGGPRTAGIDAVTEALVLRLPGEVFLAALRDEPDFALAVMRDLVAKLRATDHRLEAQSTMTLAHRLSTFLREASAGSTVRLTQSQIADRLGVSREAVNRRLQVMQAEGVIEARRGRIVILREDAL